MHSGSPFLGFCLDYSPVNPFCSTPMAPLQQVEASGKQAASGRAKVPSEVGGCGGFGKGNFRWVLGRHALRSVQFVLALRPDNIRACCWQGRS